MPAETHLVRAPFALGYDTRDAFVVRRPTPGAEARRFTEVSADLARAIFEALAEPRTREELLAHLSELAEDELAWDGPIADAVEHLRAAGAIVDHRLDAAPATRRASGKAHRGRVVLALGGGVAASFAPALVELLLARGLEVRVAATKSALRFVAPLALEALTHAPVTTSLWPTSSAEPVPHLALARWADLVIVWPATATSIARIATGSCATVVSTVALATRAPVLVFPSMNEAMLRAPAVQRNLEVLRGDGFLVALGSVGLEVADAPGARAIQPGAAPPVGAIAELAVSALSLEGTARGGRRLEAIDWDAAYAGRVQDLAWHVEALDDDMRRALVDLQTLQTSGRRGARLVDLGTGTGTAAIAAHDLGFVVTATDVSSRALDRAASGADGRSILWIEDDVRRTALRGTFDVVVDRGLLHVLPRADHPVYLASVRRLLAPGGHLVAKVHAEGASAELRTVRFTSDRLETFARGAGLEVLSITPSTFDGPNGRSEPAFLLVARRGAVADAADAR